MPFLLKFNVNTQLRYLNTLDSDETFTDHLGVVREVHTRNDITVNRAMFILGGYIFDPRARYSFTVWTSAGAASIIVAGNIGWPFSKALAITGGYTGVPGSRSLVATFPFFTATDRSMADNFFRPGFTQGVWANGEPVKGLNYLDVRRQRSQYPEYLGKQDRHAPAVFRQSLVGTAGTLRGTRQITQHVRRLFRLRQSPYSTWYRVYEIAGGPFFESRSIQSREHVHYNSDGVLAFSTGAFAPGVTVDKATYRMWAADAGIKWSGLAVNAQYFMRWLSDFEADGLLPLTSTFDHGGEVSASFFVESNKVDAVCPGIVGPRAVRRLHEYAAG